MNDETYMRRCFVLAARAGKHVKLNPLVGAVIVYQNRIIGEGYHRKYGENHAEVEAIQSILEEDRKFLSLSTLYVSLEPCNHQGQTPPCTNAILQNKIPKVVISCLDPNPLMSGKSIRLLQENGVHVKSGILNSQGTNLISIYKTTAHQRPYVILKYAQSADGFIGKEGEQIWLSNPYSKVLVHKWRSEVDGILIGVNTANVDNPELTTRLYPGQSPMRIILDPNNRLKTDLKLLHDGIPLLIFTTHVHSDSRYITLPKEKFEIKTILHELFKLGIYRLLVEGGKYTLNMFINEQLWDEARVITSPVSLNTGLKAPTIVGQIASQYKLDNNSVTVILNRNT